MKCFFISCFLIFLHHGSESSWKIKYFKNNSDLKVVSASYTKPKKKKIGHLTKSITQELDPSSLNFNYTVAETSKGCSRIDLSDGYYISLDAHPAHAIMWARAKTKENKKHIGKDVLDVHKHHYAARVFLEHEDEKKPLTYAVQGYEQEGSIFNVFLSGNNGKYVISLKNIWG